ncbi:MAG TPA: C45 family peptidase [Planctomycetota bacterium]|nr:C45 family peptidase [Planctomycetota bacterium]
MTQPGSSSKPAGSALWLWLPLGIIAAAVVIGYWLTASNPIADLPPFAPPPAAGAAAPTVAPRSAPAPTVPPAASATPVVAQGEGASDGQAVRFWPEGSSDTGDWHGRLTRPLSNLAILTVRGTPAERGTAHGALLGKEVRALVNGVNSYLKETTPADPAGHLAACLDGARVMKNFLEPEVLAELQACAAAAKVDPDELLLAQLFGDVNRSKKFATYCSCYAAFGPATADGGLLVGRNFDYAGHGLEKTIPLILQEIPAPVSPASAAGAVGPVRPVEAARPFVTIGYAGILNGWTAMNADGLCSENNTLFGGTDSLEGLATCFLVRKVVEHARTVEEGVAILENTPRACTTGMLVAGKNAAGQWDARLCEFDHAAVATVEPNAGVLLETNTCQKLNVAPGRVVHPEQTCSRYQTMLDVITANRGKLTFETSAREAIAKKGVYMSINLHCAVLDPAHQRILLAVSGGIAHADDGGVTTGAAAEKSFHIFEVSATRVTMQAEREQE